MRTIFILLASICVYVLSCSFYAGWTGHGLLRVKAGFFAIGLMVAALMVILTFCAYQLIRKRRGEWRQWMSRTALLAIGWAATFYIVLKGLDAGEDYGRHFYWKAHKSELESIALKQLEHRQTSGFYHVPTNEVAQLDYPVFVHNDPSNGLQVVGFAHWSTTPDRRGGFLFVKVPSNQEITGLQTNTEWFKQLNTNWFKYSEYKAFKSMTP